ncbi:MAG: M4 family metallopeptidase [Bacteroidota bacterium]
MSFFVRFICTSAGLSLLLISSLQAQESFKPHLPAEVQNQSTNPGTMLGPINPEVRDLLIQPRNGRDLFQTRTDRRTARYQPSFDQGTSPYYDSDNGQLYAIIGRPDILGAAARIDKLDALAYLRALSETLGIERVDQELVLGAISSDRFGGQHLRISQQYQGVPFWQSDARLHAGAEGFSSYTGRLFPSPVNLDIVPSFSRSAAEELAKRRSDDWIDLPAEQLAWISGPQLEAELVIHQDNDEAILAWMVQTRPNLSTHHSFIIDAHTGNVLNEHGHVCRFLPELNADHHHEVSCTHAPIENATVDELGSTVVQSLLPPTTATVLNLFNQFVTINVFSDQGNFFLADATKPMFMDDGMQISGLLLTYDAAGGSPQLENFSPSLGSSSNNTDWTRTAASVHSNAGIAFDYFFDEHQRLSIDGDGGDVLSIMNVNEPDGSEMDNAFWNGQALFYGNGNQAFNQLPRGLDVAGHEMAHGVIQSTADLIYQEQPGALNESFADIFGYLVEAETGDFRIGEDAVNTQVFTSGTMRNMLFPNNGAAGPQDFRWQPAHMDEYQNLPVNADNDNGGVHINSGIPNRAFALFATEVGDAVAEDVYYLALTEFLTRSSRFADARIGVVQAATQIHGAGSAVVQAAENAFAAVGIGGPAGDYTVDLETNSGERFLLLTNVAQTALFRAQEDGTLLDNPLEEVTVMSRPSITDDGRFAVFVDDQGRLRLYDLETRTLSFIENNPQTDFRNIVISKDGTRIAATKTPLDNQILIFDFVSSVGFFYELFNPTTANNGVSTGEVSYADAMEWEPSGEFLMYDALSEASTGSFWDIGFMRVWDNTTNDFGDGTIIKLFSNLPEGISIGNPTFARNSDYIIAYEEVDFDQNIFRLITRNTETNDFRTFFNNGIINYPNFGIADDRIVFDAETQGGDRVLGVRSLDEDKITPLGTPTSLVPGGHWGLYYATGDRDLDTAVPELLTDSGLLVYPNPVDEVLFIQPGELSLSGATYELQTMAGRSLLKGALGEAVAFELSTRHLLPGSYLLRIETPQGILVQPLIKL